MDLTVLDERIELYCDWCKRWVETDRPSMCPECSGFGCLHASKVEVEYFPVRLETPRQTTVKVAQPLLFAA